MFGTIRVTRGQFVVAGFAHAAQGVQGGGSVLLDDTLAVVDDQFRIQVGEQTEGFGIIPRQPEAHIGTAQPRLPSIIRIGNLPTHLPRPLVDGKIQGDGWMGGGCGSKSGKWA